MKFRKTLKHRKKGGELVGKGAYGCVFRPAIRCEGNRTRSTNEISKFMSRNAAKSEFAKKAYLSELNADQSFIVYPTRMCRPPMYMNRSFRERNNLQECSLKDEKPTHLLQMKNAGNSLYKKTLSAEDSAAFLLSLKHLCWGLKKLHDANIAHLDIKLANIVTQKQLDGSFLTRFVDVGLLQKMTDYESVSDDEKSVFSLLYYVWPFETRYLDPESHIESNVTKQQTAIYYQNVVRKIEPAIEEEDIYYTSTSGHTLTPAVLNDTILPYLRAFPTSLERNIFIAKATDVYSLGLVFLQLNAFLKSSPLKTLGKKMMHVIPQHRPTMSAVYEDLTLF